MHSRRSPGAKNPAAREEGGSGGRGAAGRPVNVDDRDDAALLAGIARRDEEAFRTIVSRHGSGVYGVALRLLKDPTLAEEVAQDALVALWLHPERVKPARGNLQTFLRGVARFKAIDSIRQEEARRGREATEVRSGLVEDFSGDTVDQLHYQQQVHHALSRLSKVQRDMIILTYYNGITCRDAAETLGIPLGTAKTRLRDAMTNLRRVLVHT
ncbi:MAG: sigma-70 family RNA polymerase sigma factor [Actinomycetota bacterium]|nr:sigma-70 family RNA polymerase sigma factor [Actinomycetota bacterium]